MTARFVRDNRGATLIENLVAVLLGSVLMLCLYGYFRSEIYHALIVEAKTGILEDARGALEMMLRDLKNAGSWGSGAVPVETGKDDDPQSDADGICNRIYAASPAVIHVQMDLNGNGTCADIEPRENIRYELGGPTASCPGKAVLRRNGDCLVANVVPSSGGKVFTFFDSRGNNLGAAPDQNAIRRIRIEFAVEARNPDPKRSDKLVSSLSSGIDLRN
jgi:type II secretory pathway component PulJ